MFKRVWGRLTFDAAWYLAAYPDVRDAVEGGLFRRAFDHYWQFGRHEGRPGREPYVAEQWYLEIYPDVREGIARGDFKSARDHFITLGWREGRLPAPFHAQVPLKSEGEN